MSDNLEHNKYGKSSSYENNEIHKYIRVLKKSIENFNKKKSYSLYIENTKNFVCDVYTISDCKIKISILIPLNSSGNVESFKHLVKDVSINNKLDSESIERLKIEYLTFDDTKLKNALLKESVKHIKLGKDILGCPSITVVESNGKYIHNFEEKFIHPIFKNHKHLKIK